VVEAPAEIAFGGAGDLSDATVRGRVSEITDVAGIPFQHELLAA
jgi:hypothetical protein